MSTLSELNELTPCISGESYTSVEGIYAHVGDKEVAEKVMEDIANFLIKEWSTPMQTSAEIKDRKRHLKTFRVSPVRYDSIKCTIELIKNLPNLQVIGGHSNTEVSSMTWVTERNITVMQISQQAFEALDRYAQELQKKEPRPRVEDEENICCSCVIL